MQSIIGVESGEGCAVGCANRWRVLGKGGSYVALASAVFFDGHRRVWYAKRESKESLYYLWLMSFKQRDLTMSIYKPGRPNKFNPFAGKGSKPSKEPGEYRIRDKKGDLAYIGETNNLRRRMGEHKRFGKMSDGGDYTFEWKRQINARRRKRAGRTSKKRLLSIILFVINLLAVRAALLNIRRQRTLV